MSAYAGREIDPARRTTERKGPDPMNAFCREIKPDGEEFLKVLRREGTPSRVHCIELFIDGPVQQEIIRRFDLAAGLSPADPWYGHQVHIRLQRFLGYDHVTVGLEGTLMPAHSTAVKDTASLEHAGGVRSWMAERGGPIQNWEDFEKYPWVRPENFAAATLEWYSKNLPDDMVIVGGLVGHFDEYLCWLFGYENLCYALFEQRDLVLAMKAKLEEIYEACVRLLVQFDRVKAIWGSDDMGFRGGLLIGPEETRRLVLPGHKKLAELAHAAGRLYLLHSCGDMSEIMTDLIDDVKIDAKHSFEDTIEDVRDAKRKYGDRLTLFGGIDVDFLCRSGEEAIRRRVRETIEVCQPGGGWFLGTGNSVANYIPVDNFLAMLDEGRRWGL
jgi:uroporphyrinogen decarboxylase